MMAQDIDMFDMLHILNLLIDIIIYLLMRWTCDEVILKFQNKNVNIRFYREKYVINLILIDSTKFVEQILILNLLI